MGTYSASCKENTGNKTSSISRTKQHRLTLVLNCCLWQENWGSLKIKKLVCQNSIKKYSANVLFQYNLKWLV